MRMRQQLRFLPRPSQLALLATGALGFWLAAPLTARAQEYCISCAGPDTLYRCVIDGARPGVSTPFQMLCQQALTKAGSHASCALKRDIGVIDCNGPVRHVALPADGAEPVVAAAKADPAPVSGAPKGDPKTVAEVLARAKESNDKAWEKANAQTKANNEKIGDFFAKSWTCVSSLFSNCDAQK